MWFGYKFSADWMSPDPEKVGRTQSHGCFRLANWNANHLIHLVENSGFEIMSNPRTKTMVKPKCSNQAAAWIRKARCTSFFHQGPKLYNSIPAQLGELENFHQPAKNNVESFKHRLDEYLKDIPDDPGMTANSLCPNNY